MGVSGYKYTVIHDCKKINIILKNINDSVIIYKIFSQKGR